MNHLAGNSPSPLLPRNTSLVPHPHKAPSFFEKIKGWLKSWFSSSEKKICKDSAKNPSAIQVDLHEEAEGMLNRLLIVRDELRHNVDSELFDCVENLITPMERDIKRIQKMMAQKESIFSQERTQRKYQQWVNKANIWLNLAPRMGDQVAVIKAVITHTFADANGLIEQDLELIADYKAHLIESLKLSDEEKHNLRMLIQVNLQYHTEALKQLQQIKSHSLELRKVSQWKAEVNSHRSALFDKALHVIDSIVHKASRENPPETDSQSTTLN